MIPFYYRAYKYSWNEDRYRTPGVDGPKAVPELGSDGVALAPQSFPEAAPLKGRPEASAEAKASGAKMPESVYVGAPPSPYADPLPHPFHIPTQWDSKAVLRALGAPKCLVGLDLWALDCGILDAAEALAEKYSARLLLAHIHAETEADPEGEEILRRLRGLHAPYEYHSFPGSPAEVLLRESRLQQASLILLATHGRKGKERVLQGSVAERVLKQADIPVLIHRPGTRWPRLKKILLPFEDLTGAQPALGPAMKLCRGFGGELWMLHVRKDSERPSGEGDNAKDLPAGLPQEHSEIREIDARGGIPQSIAAFAEAEDIDLLVMPSQREDPSKTLLPGGVTAQVAREVHCSVLVVPK